MIALPAELRDGSIASSAISLAFHKPLLVGELLLLGTSLSSVVSRRRIYANRDLLVGRDETRCQWVLDDPYLSSKHLRVYSVIYESDGPGEVGPLVFAEDLSRNGTFLNGNLIGKGSGGFLLSDNDDLRLSRQTNFRFVACNGNPSDTSFDLLQEKEMTAFEKQYILTDRLLGAGAFGKVFMAINKSTQKQVACKLVDIRTLKKPSANADSVQERPAPAEDVDYRVQMQKVKLWTERHQLQDKVVEYLREAELLSSISHPNVIRLEKVFVTENTIYMFEELVTAGDLYSYLQMKGGKLIEVDAAVIIRQVLVALTYLHEHNIVHRDLKLDNIMMTHQSSGCRVVLTDFGAARSVEPPIGRMRSPVGTVEYAAPEMVHPSDSGAYTKAVDLWSVGVIAVILLTGNHAFPDPESGRFSEALAGMADLRSLKATRAWQTVRRRPQEFVGGLLVHDEAVRMTAQQALGHTWFSNEINKSNFEDLYMRAIKGWHHRTMQKHVIEFLEPSDSSRFSRLRTTSRDTAQGKSVKSIHHSSSRRNRSILRSKKRGRSCSTLGKNMAQLSKHWSCRLEDMLQG